MPAENVVVKLDFSNAFNCLHRFDTLMSVEERLGTLTTYPDVGERPH